LSAAFFTGRERQSQWHLPHAGLKIAALDPTMPRSLRQDATDCMIDDTLTSLPSALRPGLPVSDIELWIRGSLFHPLLAPAWDRSLVRPMADFRQLALEFVLADDEAKLTSLARQAASGLSTNTRLPGHPSHAPATVLTEHQRSKMRPPRACLSPAGSRRSSLGCLVAAATATR
jgi:hypothetical protein